MKKSKEILKIAALSAVIVFSMFNFAECATADAATLSTSGNPSVTIVNNTGFTIYYVAISETTSDLWGQNKLGSDEMISNGQSVSLRLPNPINRVNNYDIRLLDSDGDEYTKYNLIIGNNSRIVFTKDDLNLPTITILNNTGYTVHYVYVSETTSDKWGADRLKSNQILRNGQTVSIELPHYIGNVNKYNILLVDSDGDQYIKEDVIVRAGSRIEFTLDDINMDRLLERVSGD